MELQNLVVKLPVAPPADSTLAALIPVLHGWIQKRARPELLIDLADYRHVPAGPGLVLIGLEADYSLDHSGGRWGVRYSRKAPVTGSPQERLSQALTSALEAGQALAADPALAGGIRYSGQELEIYLNDRALAVNDAAGIAALRGVFEPFLQARLDGVGYELAPAESDPRALPGLHVRFARAFTFAELLSRFSLQPVLA